jgi:hypothetical protein
VIRTLVPKSSVRPPESSSQPHSSIEIRGRVNGEITAQVFPGFFVRLMVFAHGIFRWSESFRLHRYQQTIVLVLSRRIERKYHMLDMSLIFQEWSSQRPTKCSWISMCREVTEYHDPIQTFPGKHSTIYMGISLPAALRKPFSA